MRQRRPIGKNSLALMNINYHRDINIEEVINTFAQRQSRRQRKRQSLVRTQCNDFRPTVFIGTNLEPPFLEILVKPLQRNVNKVASALAKKRNTYAFVSFSLHHRNLFIQALFCVQSSQLE